ncbi:MAG: F0F1 ATP synthase subunit alpha [bacterium]|nr:F0F1 ATP synthase subunit alpha [bacterium]
MSQEHLKTFLSAIDTALEETKLAAAPTAAAGIIRSSKDGIIHVEGLPNIRLGEVLRVEESDTEAFVMQIDQLTAYAVVLQSDREVREGLAVFPTGSSLVIDASDELIGRVVNPLGKILDGGAPAKTKAKMPLESIAPGVMSRTPVNQPVQTGILAIDALIPIGRGQRELIIGDRQTGKTTVAVDTIINQKDQGMICIYVAIGQREAKTAAVVETLREHGALEHTIIVSAGASETAVLQFLAPYAGVAIGEFFMNQGKDVLVVYDDLSKHAVAYRELSLLLRKPPGREAYPGDVFYIHSRLLERAVKLNSEHGGGSITALPIIETQAGDVSAYIPTNVISITDGQIFLESNLFYRGIRPAINIGISVSRVGSAAQTKVMKKVAGTAKLDLAQYYELAAFSQFASELDPATKQQLVRGERVVEAMKQRAHKPYKLWEEVVVLWVATNGYLDQFKPAEVVEKLHALLNEVAARQADFVTMIQTQKEWNEDVVQNLKSIAENFFAKAKA